MYEKQGDNERDGNRCMRNRGIRRERWNPLYEEQGYKKKEMETVV